MYSFAARKVSNNLAYLAEELRRFPDNEECSSLLMDVVLSIDARSLKRLRKALENFRTMKVDPTGVARHVAYTLCREIAYCSPCEQTWAFWAADVQSLDDARHPKFIVTDGHSGPKFRDGVKTVSATDAARDVHQSAPADAYFAGTPSTESFDDAPAGEVIGYAPSTPSKNGYWK